MTGPQMQAECPKTSCLLNFSSITITDVSVGGRHLQVRSILHTNTECESTKSSVDEPRINTASPRDGCIASLPPMSAESIHERRSLGSLAAGFPAQNQFRHHRLVIESDPPFLIQVTSIQQLHIAHDNGATGKP